MAGNLIAKAIGVAAIGISGYDALTTANRQASRYSTAAQLERVNDMYLRTDALDGESVIGCKMQKWARNWHLNNNWLFNGFDKITGYASSLFQQIGNNITTIGLGALTLFSLSKPKVAAHGAKMALGTKLTNMLKIPMVGKIAAGILALQAGKFVLCDLMGIGKGDPKRTTFNG